MYGGDTYRLMAGDWDEDIENPGSKRMQFPARVH
ncbi:hypothetical protein M7I_8089 [Glarea lozoyensis 74030]|uniref:Uncharacterized protein n=1 Tax=Glarea lozoyensis (strain ATCC 74030 / MF5533) TaxID=1104152 RepID=H0EZ27_GLAL7|nr:hypothetical protein M7I_8089 [Glarea lozoyensis 74030]